MRLLDVGVFLAANSADVERASEMLVRGVLFDDFRAFFRRRFDDDGNGFDGRFDRINGNDDGIGYGFDDFLVFRLPGLGAARFQDRQRSSPLRVTWQKGLEKRESAR
ncbi:MAG TPA: hypothetical protein VK760_13320 [Candidatus Acidoferrales bacterium]|nr:hypothetical protein [Candidatus Acidoferrales bacterium]